MTRRKDAPRKQRRTDGEEDPLTGELGLLAAILDRAIKDAQGYKLAADMGSYAQREALAWLTEAYKPLYEPPEPWSCRWVLEQVNWPESFRRRIYLVVLQSERGVLGKRLRLNKYLPR